ncbi:hypothetical protein E2C01_062617 [Portunus trituberculatus]|uniref:Uncharacterized protein n=1 Tax=Portunus trituberculatus TaxID=210409 RepID=A0A5B7HEI2_PORTR|nr:hypothetical protein [Portunus trituberculatus]
MTGRDERRGVQSIAATQCSTDRPPHATDPRFHTSVKVRAPCRPSLLHGKPQYQVPYSEHFHTVTLYSKGSNSSAGSLNSSTLRRIFYLGFQV